MTNDELVIRLQQAADRSGDIKTLLLEAAQALKPFAQVLFEEHERICGTQKLPVIPWEMAGEEAHERWQMMADFIQRKP